MIMRLSRRGGTTPLGSSPMYSAIILGADIHLEALWSQNWLEVLQLAEEEVVMVNRLGGSLLMNDSPNK